jgi:hypothetical protein
VRHGPRLCTPGGFIEPTHHSDDAAISATFELITAGKSGQLVLDELRREDLAFFAWPGGPSHLRAVERALNRVASGHVEYLVIRAPAG